MQTQDATQTGVSAAELAAAEEATVAAAAAEQEEIEAGEHQDDELQRPLTPTEKREQMRETIHRKTAEARESESHTEEPDADAKKPTAPVLNEHLVEKDGKQYVKLKVDGQERLVPFDDAVRNLQKAGAADRRLQEAAERQRQLEDRERNIAANEQRLQAKLSELHKQPPANAGADPDEQDIALAKKAWESMLDGDEEEAPAALARLIAAARSHSPTVDPEAIAQVALHKIQEREFDKGIEKGKAVFAEEYSDIMADPILFEVANQKTIALQDEHPDWSPEQIILEAGRLTREWRNGGKQQSSSSGTERLERKQNLKPMPKATAARTPKADEKPLTEEEMRLKAIRETTAQRRALRG